MKQASIKDQSPGKSKVQKDMEKLRQVMLDVHKALTSDEGKALGCRVQMLNDQKRFIVYQGIRSNIWASFHLDGKIHIYRYALRKLLINHPESSKHLSKFK